jgi:hypothetical protein
MSTSAGPLDALTISLMRAYVPVVSDMNRLLPVINGDGGTFRIISGRLPDSEVEMSALLSDAIPGSWLIKYDARSATGFFRMFNGNAPNSGTVLALCPRA